jgi:hypothetical protein
MLRSFVMSFVLLSVFTSRLYSGRLTSVGGGHGVLLWEESSSTILGRQREGMFDLRDLISDVTQPMMNSNFETY